MRDAIVATARGLIQRFGFRKTTMDDIARAMGKERTSLYYYFPGKKEIVNALLECEFASVTQAVHEETSRHADAASRLRVYLQASLDQVVQRSAMYSLILPELRGGGGGVPDIFRINELRISIKKAEENYLVDILSQGHREGQFRAMSEAKARPLARFILSTLQGLEMDLFYVSSNVAELKARLDVASDVFIRGLQR
jgi:AcrR family transcriptional regulator